MGFLLLKVMMNLVERYEIKILARSVAVFSSSCIGILLCDNFNFNIKYINSKKYEVQIWRIK